MIGVLGSVTLLFGVISGRLVQLQLVDGQRYAALGESQRLRPVTLPAERGSILDRFGNDLALSVPQKTVFADPRLVTDPAATARSLAPALGVDEATLQSELSSASAFVYLKRQVDNTTAAMVEGMKLRGVYLIDESKRFNPSGALAQGVLGSVNIDNKGISGLESQYNQILTGVPGELVLERDPSGRTIATGQHRITPAQPGDDLVLSIDQALQYEAESALAAQVEKMGAKGGMAIVSNPRTGEILAMASVDRATDGTTSPSTYNKTLTNVFEPGSANKIITMSAALEEGVTTPQTQIEVPDQMKVADFNFSDDNPHPTMMMTPTDILTVSSNIGTIKLAQALGPARMDAYLRKFGFSAPTSLGFPDEARGLLLPLDSWSGTSIATIPIGQGVAVTALQMLQAYNVIANGGVYVEPKLVLATVDKQGKRHDTAASKSHRVLSTTTANQVRDMMVSVVQQGTGMPAAIEGYTVAGKTGTARKPQSNGGYADAAGRYHYVATFAGFTPAENPALSAIVVVDEPTKTIFGSAVSAPVFSRLVSYALRRFEVPPPGIVLKPSVPAPSVTDPSVQAAPPPGAKVRQDPAVAPTTTTTIAAPASPTVPPPSSTPSTTTPSATGPPGKQP